MGDSYATRDQSFTPAMERLRAELETRTGRPWDVYRMNFSDKQDLVIVAPPDERRTKAPPWMPPDDDEVLRRVFGPYRYHKKSAGDATIPTSDIDTYIARAAALDGARP